MHRAKSVKAKSLYEDEDKMPKTKTQQQVEKEVFDLVGNEFTLLGQYIGANEKVLMRHNKCGYEWEVKYSNFKNNGSRCPKCNGCQLKTTEQYKKEVLDLVGNQYMVTGEYINSRTPIKMIHKTCSQEIAITPNNFLRGARCVHCFGNSMKDTATFKDEVAVNFPDYEVIGEYQGNKTPIQMFHKPCGTAWKVTPNNLLRGYGCPTCASSKGEKGVRDYLTRNGYIFSEQHTFPDFRFIKELPFDFAVFNDDQSLLCLIEFDGEFHFKPARFKRHDNVARFKVGKQRDLIKDQYCLLHGIPLIRIPFYQSEYLESLLRMNLFYAEIC